MILDDAGILNPFSLDPYIAQRHVRSVFCLPLMNQAKLIGVLYLENNQAPRVFAPARTAVLKLLASQAAISQSANRGSGVWSMPTSSGSHLGTRRRDLRGE